MISQKAPQKRQGLFVLAILLLLSGGAAVFVGFHNSTIRSLGVVAIMASMYLVRISRVHDRSVLPIASGQEVDFNATESPGRLAWAAGIGLLLLLGVSYLLMYIDALHGGHTAWPVYLFAAVGLACACAWGYIAAKLS